MGTGIAAKWHVIKRFNLRSIAIKPIVVATLVSTGLLTTTMHNANAMDGGVTFNDISAGGYSGIDYRRKWSERHAKLKQIHERRIYTRAVNGLKTTLHEIPGKPYGAPGIAIFDYDNDGDKDIYVSNGPGKANSLYANQMMQTMRADYIDVATKARVDATDQDSNGICVGDTDNDGDIDMLVLGAVEPNRFFENMGDGTFMDKTMSSGLGGGNEGSSGCSMGDIDGDGLIDIVVANTSSDWSHFRAISKEYFALNSHNQLYLNKGNSQFEDISLTSGITNLKGFPPENTGSAGVTWSVAMVDYDQDGDVDIFFGDDQGSLMPAMMGGIDRGLIHIMQNDGTGKFNDVVVEAKTNKQGMWMGFSFGDLNCDGNMDFFATNGGDYAVSLMYNIMTMPPYPIGTNASRWFLQQDDGTFTDPGNNEELKSSLFGWGTTIDDYDNDGDQDIFYHGGLSMSPVLLGSPGAHLRNMGCTGGEAKFVYDIHSRSDTNHSRRTVHGLASGDLNEDGFVDIVSVSSVDIPQRVPMMKYPARYNVDLDRHPDGFVMEYTPLFLDRLLTGKWSFFWWLGYGYEEGSLSVEYNSANNNNGWAKVSLLGTKGLTTGGKVNRNGIGAVLKFTPEGGSTVMRPIIAGDSYASNNSMESIFGLGLAFKGTLEVLWPGGTRNRLYNVMHGERILMPEIPCDIGADWADYASYANCLQTSLKELLDQEKITFFQRQRLFYSASQAWFADRNNF